MADVLVTTVGRWVVVFALMRTLRLHEYGGWPAVAVWIPACLAAWRWRSGQAVLAIVAFVSMAAFVPHNGIMSIAWMAAAVALFSGRDLLLAVRVKAATVYGFTAAHKAIGTFASGAVLASAVPWLPAPWLVAPVVIVTEALLAVAVLRRWPVAFPLAVVFHLGIWLSMGLADPARFVSLAAWQLTMPVLVWYATNPIHGPAREATKSS